MEIALGHEKTVCDPVDASVRCRTASITDIPRETTPGTRAASRIPVVTTIPKLPIVAVEGVATNEGLRLVHSNPLSLRRSREAAMRPFVAGLVCH